jgi:hypothetical protein
VSQRKAAKALGVGLGTVQRDLTRNGSPSDPKRVTKAEATVRRDLRRDDAPSAPERRSHVRVFPLSLPGHAHRGVGKGLTLRGKTFSGRAATGIPGTQTNLPCGVNWFRSFEFTSAGKFKVWLPEIEFTPQGKID